jgi:hypothetical protein
MSIPDLLPVAGTPASISLTVSQSQATPTSAGHVRTTPFSSPRAAQRAIGISLPVWPRVSRSPRSPAGSATRASRSPTRSTATSSHPPSTAPAPPSTSSTTRAAASPYGGLRPEPSGDGWAPRPTVEIRRRIHSCWAGPSAPTSGGTHGEAVIPPGKMDALPVLPVAGPVRRSRVLGWGRGGRRG